MKTGFLFLLLWLGMSGESYRRVFGEDYEKALAFTATHEKDFELAAQRFQVDSRFLKTIVFPELIRYSQFRDFFETTALEWLYVQGGSQSADFSIGPFQMKPSFAETIESYASSEESLRAGFGFVALYDSGSPIRHQRLERLKQLSWQLVYLSCFIKIADHRFSAYPFAGEIARLRFYCVAYNAGFMREEASINALSEQRNFPYGSKYPSEMQYVYADVAIDYFNRYLRQ